MVSSILLSNVAICLSECMFYRLRMYFQQGTTYIISELVCPSDPTKQSTETLIDEGLPSMGTCIVDITQYPVVFLKSKMSDKKQILTDNVR